MLVWRRWWSPQVSRVTGEFRTDVCGRGHLQVHVIPEVQAAAHLPDVKKPERRNVAKREGRLFLVKGRWGGAVKVTRRFGSALTLQHGK